ncbi:villin-1 [Morus notabilis]|uniref:villin-1 n=1 Tax=Morus notabilis TaxID=981085 RepID=UPI000CED1828|nr:villin-1 [Morus notabilis]XP_024026713.1 villin-1 [Morus notabilis]
MSLNGKDIDQAFQSAGTKAGLEIWCVENLQLIPVPKSSHGKFYCGSAYIVLHTVVPKNGPPQHDIHYWLGNDSNKVDSVLASDKALELDEALGSCTVQYREVQGQETEKFLSYFKPCIIPVEGVYSSRPGQSSGETYQIKLLTCKGDHVVHVKEVPFSRSSLNHNDVFILDTASKIFLFSGCNSSTQERAKALEVVQYIKDTKHGGKCDVATVEDGKFVGDHEVGEFWSLFGGYAPIPRESPSFFQDHSDAQSGKLFWITLQGKLCQCETDSLTRELLEADKCYMLDCDSEIFVWLGRLTLVTERKTSVSAAEDFLRNHGRSAGTHLSLITEGLESTKFRSYFTNWPQKVEPRLYEEGKEKVAAIFKQHGYEVKELPEEELEPLIDCKGTIKVWRVDGDEWSLVPVPEQKKLFSGDCYIVQYTYPSNGRDENLFYAWLGRDSVPEDRRDVITHANAIIDSTKGEPVMARILQDKEANQFFFIFQTLIIYKGGKSTRYKEFIAEKGIADETYDESKEALFRIQGTSPNHMQAIQVDHVSSSLNSSYCYILQTGTSIFTWIGNLSSPRDHDLLDTMLEFLNPTWLPVSVREGNEPDIFWEALGGKTEYPKGKEIKLHVEDPHLFLLNVAGGDFKVKEIYNFTQDDLTTEDVLVLDCHNEIYVWVGCRSKAKSKEQALAFALKFIETDILAEELSLEMPIYVVNEGHEPSFFTRFFVWDSSKANMHGNSFERKLATLKGKQQSLEAPIRHSRKAYSRETTPEGLRSEFASHIGRIRSPSPAPRVPRSSRKSPINNVPSPPQTIRNLFPESPNHSNPVPPSVVTRSLTEDAGSTEANGNEAGSEINLQIHPYERLTVVSSDPVKGIDVTKKEAYLSTEEFEAKFKMTRADFYKLPKWKQNKLKMSLNLF